MYYLRKLPHEDTIPPIYKTDGTFVPERKYITDDMAIFKHHDFSRFYRGLFGGLDAKYQGMKVYTCKSLKRILELREMTFNYCGDWFDVYDENGVVHGDWEKAIEL